MRFELDSAGILLATLDLPGRSMNVLNASTGAAIAAMVERVESDPAVKGLVLTSGKKDFLAGADLEGIRDIQQAADAALQAYELSLVLKGQLRRLERCGKPAVAVVHGQCLGGGLELALACHHRIVVDDGRARLGLPEVKLGLLPGGGGTQRLPRLVGMQTALQMMGEGNDIRADKALAIGLVGEKAADREAAIAQARAWCLAHPKAQQPWDAPKFRYPGGDSRSPQAVQMLSIAPSMASAKSYGNYPAVTHIMSCVYEGGLVDFDNALQIESRYFAACVASPEARNMLGTLWFQLNAIKKGASRPAGVPPSKLRRLGILGAGMMGAGIAHVSAQAGIEVVLLDTTQEAAERGKAYGQGLLDAAVKKGRRTAAQRDEQLARITATTDYAALAGCELVIEAVFEDRAVKAEVTARAEAVLGADAVFASNTSTLPITGLARASQRPAQFIGLHFFSPVDKMPLVEIIVGAQTDEATLARAFDYVLQIGKTPIVVNDRRGFYTSRVFGTYVMEGIAMLAEGVHPRHIEQAGLQAGMPMPPLALQDEVSLSLAVHVADQTRKDLAAEGTPYSEHPGMAVVRALAEQGRLGKKAGAGFYDYGGDKQLWPGLAKQFPPAASQPPQQELIDRLMIAQANEAARCLHEGVLRSVADGNIGSIFGWGFAPFQGGALQYINAMGAKRFVDRARELAARHGPRFEPAPNVVALAESGGRF
ncbi:MAG: enoyl-CoA hydratase/isomerase family protein [Burkholderiaceae bacterium]|nr:enoyl-CoA hydratase/isomerase family protein [Burkholderiaceae bacterium]